MKKKREKVKGRARAIVCMILLIVLSIPIGSGLSLSRERDEAEISFDPYGDLYGCMEAAANMTTLAGKYMKASNSELMAAEQANSRLEMAWSIREKAEAYEELTESVTALYNLLGTVDMTEEDGEYREGIYADYLSYADMISHSEYNDKAIEFNAKFRNSPGRVFGELMGVSELELFE